MPKKSAAGDIYGGFTASKIRRLIRRAVIFSADFRRTNFRRRIRRSAANCRYEGRGTMRFSVHRVWGSGNGVHGFESETSRKLNTFACSFQSFRLQFRRISQINVLNMRKVTRPVIRYTCTNADGCIRILLNPPLNVFSYRGVFRGIRRCSLSSHIPTLFA